MFGRSLMDSFMDKIAQKFSSQDVIRANSEAEAKELEAAKEKIAEYENILSEIRRLNLKSVETNEITNQLVQSSVEKLEEYRIQGVGKDYTEDIESIKSSIKDQEDYIHKENVRVYRNVQASIVDELKLQTEALSIQNKALERKLKGIKPVAIIGLVFSGITMLAAVAYVLFDIVGIAF